MRALASTTLAVAIAAAAPSAKAEEIVPGATYELVEPGEIPAPIHLLILDLTAAELRFEATASEDRGLTTSEFAAAADADIAVNGGPFSPLDFAPYGIAIGRGEAWPDSDPGRGSALLLERSGPTTRADLLGPNASEALAGVIAAIAGGPMLVEDSSARADFDCDDRQAMPCDRAPRTAAGSDGTRLLIAVVDGWTAASEGATAGELAVFLAERGAIDAILLDGGSASTLYAEPLGGVVGSPSDGAERRVANHLAVVFEELEPGEMAIRVREGDIFDPDADIAGATVTLDDGRQDITDDSGRTSFDNLRPRRVCATAEAEGYEPQTECRQVPPGDSVLNQIALVPEGEGPADNPTSKPAAVGANEFAGGCAAAGRLHGDGFHATLGGLLAAALFAAAARRHRLPSGRRHRR